MVYYKVDSLGSYRVELKLTGFYSASVRIRFGFAFVRFLVIVVFVALIEWFVHVVHVLVTPSFGVTVESATVVDSHLSTVAYLIVMYSH